MYSGSEGINPIVDSNEVDMDITVEQLLKLLHGKPPVDKKKALDSKILGIIGKIDKDFIIKFVNDHRM